MVERGTDSGNLTFDLHVHTYIHAHSNHTYKGSEKAFQTNKQINKNKATVSALSYLPALDLLVIYGFMLLLGILVLSVSSPTPGCILDPILVL